MTAVVMVGLVAGCAGCIGYRPALMPLQPGEKIIFESPGRANLYRARSGNDPLNMGRVVEVTRPCSVTCE